MAEGDPGQLRRRRRGRALQGEGDVDQRVAHPGPLRPQPLDEAREGEIGVTEGGHRRVPGALHEIAEAGVSRQVGAPDEGIDVVADRLGAARAAAARRGRGRGEVAAAGVAVQEELEAGEQGHEPGSAAALAGGGQGAAQPLVEGEEARLPAVCVGLRPATRSQAERPRRRVQPLTPPLPEPLLLPRGRPRRLLGDVPRVALPGGGEERDPAAHRLRIQRVKLLQEQGQGPEIGDQMVDDEQQHGLVGRGRPGPYAEQPAASEVEGAVRSRRQLRRQLRLGDPLRLPVPVVHRGGRQHLLERLPRRLVEAGAQRRVAFGQPLQHRLEGPRLERRPDPDRLHDVVRGAVRLPALEEPERELPGRQREDRRRRLVAAPGRLLHRAAGGRFEAAGELVDGRRQQLVEGGRPGAAPLQLVPELDGRQRVQAEAGQRHVPRQPRRRRSEAGRQPLDEPIVGPRRRRGRRRGRGGGRVRPALGDDRELPRGEELPAEESLHLAARRPRQAGRRNQHDPPRLELVLLGDRRHHGIEDLVPARRAPNVHLVHQGEPLFALGLDRERRPAARAQGRVGRLCRPLDVLRIAVGSANDDQVLEAPGDVQLALPQKAEIAGAQVGQVAGLGETGGEDLAAGLGLLPVARRHVGARHPDLPHPACRARPPRVGIGDGDPPLPDRLAAAHQVPHVRPAGKGVDDPVGVELAAADGPHPRLLAARHAGHDERRFGEPVAGKEGLAPKAGRLEGRGEPLEGLAAHRLGAVEGHPPGRQVERGPLLGSALLDTQRVGEVGSAAGVGTVPRHGVEPAHRLLQEGDRRHEDARRSDVERLEDAADQPHVVVHRQPADVGRRLVVAADAADHLLVGEQAAVGDHHPLGQRGRSRGVLQEGQRLRADLRLPPGAGKAGVDVVDGQGEGGGELG